ncbi:MAG: hypothetical protein WCF84_06465 [Anaerolineae bacterium]
MLFRIPSFRLSLVNYILLCLLPVSLAACFPFGQPPTPTVVALGRPTETVPFPPTGAPPRPTQTAPATPASLLLTETATPMSVTSRPTETVMPVIPTVALSTPPTDTPTVRPTETMPPPTPTLRPTETMPPPPSTPGPLPTETPPPGSPQVYVTNIQITRVNPGAMPAQLVFHVTFLNTWGAPQSYLRWRTLIYQPDGKNSFGDIQSQNKIIPDGTSVQDTGVWQVRVIGCQDFYAQAVWEDENNGRHPFLVSGTPTMTPFQVCP